MKDANVNDTAKTRMRSVMVFWVYSAEQYANNTPLSEIAAHAELNGFNDEPVDVLCLHGHQFIPAVDIKQLRERNFILHDVSPLYREIAGRYPNLRKRYNNHFFECFLRWIVIREFYQGAPVLAWDADIFFNDKLSSIHAEFAGSTFTSSSTCFVALHDAAWLQAYAEQLDQFEQDPHAFLFTAFMQLNKAQMGGHDFHTSFFGPKLAASLNSIDTFTQTFEWTPEEMFVDHLVRTERLPYHFAKGKSKYLLCTQPLLLPKLAWTHPLGEGFDTEVGEGARLVKKDGQYEIDGRPLAFVHFQGALFRACATHQIFHHIFQKPAWLHDEYCPSGKRAGLDVPSFMASRRTETLESIGNMMSAGELREKWGNPYSERDVARNYLITGDLTDVLRNYRHSEDAATLELSTREFPAAHSLALTPADMEILLAAHLSVAGVGRMLVIAPDATSIIGNLLRRGIDARGIDILASAPETAHRGRCIAGSLADIPDDKFSSGLVLGAFDNLEEATLRIVVEKLRGTVTGSITAHVFRQDENHRSRAEWEQVFFGVGFRKHPLRHIVQSFEALECGSPIELYFERVNAETQDDLNDASRVTGQSADAVLARYEVAAQLVRPWDNILVLDCDCGAGVNVLRRTTRAGHITGIDEDVAVIKYAQAQFGAETVEFKAGNPGELIATMEPGSVDFVVCATLLADAAAVEGLLESMNRLLAPGGRIVFTMTAGTTEALQQKLEGNFICETAYRQSGNDDTGSARSLHRGSLMGLTTGECDAWIVVAMKHPLAVSPAPYRETAFRHVAGGRSASVLNYTEFYQNPWILHSMVHFGTRLNSPNDLTEAAQQVLSNSPADSADAGAALCILLYRAMEKAGSLNANASELIQKAEKYLTIAQADAHQFRWQVSIAYALGQSAMGEGNLNLARKRFAAVAAMDVFRWGPSLATKASEAIFLAGWMAYCANDLADAQRSWQRGVELGKKLLARPLEETLLNADFPNLFDHGDGMRELIYALENIAMCTNGLHGLRLKEQGIAIRWDQVFNTFRFQRDQRDWSLRQAQQRVGSLCRDIDALRMEKEMAATMASLSRQF